MHGLLGGVDEHIDELLAAGGVDGEDVDQGDDGLIGGDMWHIGSLTEYEFSEPSHDPI